MEKLRLLLIEEAAQDYLKVRRVLDDEFGKFNIDWAPNYDSALKLLKKNSYDLQLIGYYPRQSEQQKFLVQLYPTITIPTIFLTKNNEKVSNTWLDKTDFLSKEHFSWPLLERALRYLVKILALQQVEKKFRVIYDNAFEFIGLVNTKGILLEINQTTLTFLGLEREEMIDRPLWDTALATFSSKNQARLKAAFAKAITGELVRYEMEVKGAAEQIVTLDFSLKPVVVQGNVVWILAEGRDLRERKMMEQRLNLSHLHDELTGLPNRHLFIEHLEQAIVDVQREKNYQIAVLFIDLDRFKVINASLGHHMGDWLLMEIALRLRNCLKPEDFLARSGGDEFLILLDHLQDLSSATRLAESINKELACPFLLDGYEVAVSASIGIAYSSHQEGPVDLLRDVDTAMYKAKAMGKSCYAVFNRQMHTQAVSRLRIETDLHQALEQKNFVLYYQPQTKLYSGELVGVEALIRLCHPQHGLIYPVDFIPVLEDTGIIVTLGEWILRTACNQLRVWLDAGLPLDHVSVNVSARQFRNHKRLFQVVAECLEVTGLSPECLELELTETLLLEDTDSAIRTLGRFKDMGIGVTIDDFGTGYASLNYLKRFPADALKIDRSFIQGVISVPTDAAITVATIDMAHALGLTVVAEGVETADQRDFLRDHGCDWAQGYFYAAPLEESAFLKWATQYNRMMKNK